MIPLKKLAVFAVCCCVYLLLTVCLFRSPNGSRRVKESAGVGTNQRQLHDISEQNNVRISSRENSDVDSQAALRARTAVAIAPGVHENESAQVSDDGRIHPFVYPIKPTSCATALGVIYVASGVAMEDFELRKIVRSTWAKDADKFGFKVYFLVGLPLLTDLNQHQITRMLMEEDRLYRDIVQANIMDKYDRLMYKWWAELLFHLAHCKSAKFMIWADSDAIILLENLSTYVNLMSGTLLDGPNMGCELMWGEPIRDATNYKYYIPFELWPWSQLPFYCSGPFQLISASAVRRLAAEVPRLGIDYITKFLPFDVATGIVAHGAGVKIVTIGKLYPYPPVADVCSRELLMAHGFVPAARIAGFWEFRLTCCGFPVATRNCTYEITD